MQLQGEILIYKAKDGSQQLGVRLEEDTVWLTQKQITDLFGRERTVITKHIDNIFREGELKQKSVCANFAHTAADGKIYETQYYNLDVIISVGYRVKSKRGTQFRQWATQRLKDHLVKGYTLNEKRLLQVQQNMQQLEQAVKLIQQSGSTAELNKNEAKGLLEIIKSYTQSFILLNQFDSNNLPDAKLNENITYEIEYKEAVKVIT
jgi:hypothetical protein